MCIGYDFVINNLKNNKKYEFAFKGCGHIEIIYMYVTMYKVQN